MLAAVRYVFVGAIAGARAGGIFVDDAGFFFEVLGFEMVAGCVDDFNDVAEVDVVGCPGGVSAALSEC